MSIVIALMIRPPSSHRCGLRSELKRWKYLSVGNTTAGTVNEVEVLELIDATHSLRVLRFPMLTPTTVDRRYIGKNVTSLLRGQVLT